MLNTATAAGRSLIARTWKPTKCLRTCSHRFFSKGALPGGFTKEGLEQFAIRHWEEGHGQGDTRANRRRRRAAANEDENVNANANASSNNQGCKTYTDLFSQKISFECREWLDGHHDPSAAMGNAYFGSKSFLPERMLMTPAIAFMEKSRNMIRDDKGSANGNSGGNDTTRRQLTIPSSFHVNDSFLAWNVISKAPIELICEWKYPMANDSGSSGSGNVIKGLTMMAFDAPLNRVYHGNCFRVNLSNSSKSMNFDLVEKLIPYHESYAKFLLDGMVNELEKQTSQSRV